LEDGVSEIINKFFLSLAAILLFTLLSHYSTINASPSFGIKTNSNISAADSTITLTWTGVSNIKIFYIYSNSPINGEIMLIDSTEATSFKARYKNNLIYHVLTKPIKLPEGFVFTPPGTFTMGEGTNSEDSVHTVTLTKPLYIAKNVVTQAEWFDYMAFINNSGPGGLYRISEHFGLGDTYPIYCVNWYSTLVYCNKRSIAEGLTPCYDVNGTGGTNVLDFYVTNGYDIPDTFTYVCNWDADGYRLPTEAEWEYVASYNDNRTYPWGNTEPVEGISNYGGLLGKTSIVGSYPDSNSKLGISDMAGNVWEWCWDWYAPYSSKNQADPTGPTEGDWRVLRGGGWLYIYTNIRSAYRNMNSPEQLFEGFRVVRSSPLPYIASVIPAGGEVLSHNSQFQVTWSDNISEKVKIELFENDTIFVSVISDSTESDGSFQWSVPATFTGQKFKIRISSIIDSQVSGFSEDYFGIIPGKVMVTIPNGSEKVLINSTYEIKWLDNLSENVKIELYKNNVLHSSISSSTLSDGSFLWSVPDSLYSNDFMIKISSVILPALYNDKSDNNFTVYAGEPYITNILPAGGEVLSQNSQYNITWNDNILENIKIELISNDSLLVKVISESTLSSGSFLWTVPADITGQTFKLKITSLNDGQISAISNNSFSIISGSVMITAPNGNELIIVNSINDIKWIDNLSEKVKIELLKNDIFYSTISDSVASNGSYLWTVPDNFCGNGYKIKISSVSNPSLYFDLSDSSFTIYPGNVSLTAPIGGETLEMLENYNITWTGTITGDIKVSLLKSTALVTDFIISSETGEYFWNFYTSNINSGSDYKLKVESVSYPESYDESEYFTIKGTNSINGGVSGIWKEIYSPYIVTDSTYISSSNTLLIEPNVKVKASNLSNKFTVLGKIISDGNHLEMINFKDIQLIFDNASTTDSSIVAYTQFNREIITKESIGKSVFNLISIRNNSKVIVKNCELKNSNNYGIDIYNAAPVVSNCLITENSGGVHFNNSSTTYFSNNTISNNLTGLYFDGNSDPMIINCIIYGNTSHQVFLNSNDSDPEFYYNNVQGSQAGFGLGSGVVYNGAYSGNINSDPLFVAGSFNIIESSPCIDTGYPDLTYEFLGYLNIPIKDITGRSRLNGDIDIGCYEYWPSGIIPETPSNVTISVSDSLINLSWAESENAILYYIYSSNEPYGTYELTTAVANNYWQLPLGSDLKKFYYVVSSSGSTKKSSDNPSKSIKRIIKIPKIETMMLR
jgi:parallel beta-helix repeat protein